MDSKRPALIVLLTDFGVQDEYVGVMKGVISAINPEARTIDLSHEVRPQDILEAGFILYRSYRFFPKGTVFLVVVDPDVGTGRRVVILKAGGYYFLAPDNGVLSFILKKERKGQVVEATVRRYFLPTISRTFHGRDIFAPVAAHLSRGIALVRFGKKIDDPVKLHIPSPFISPKKSLVGEVIHIDRFGNLITNIDYETFRRFQRKHPARGQTLKTCNIVRKGLTPYKIEVGGKTIPRLVSSYAEARAGELLAIFGSSDHLEISLNLGSARDALKVRKGAKVEVRLWRCDEQE